MKEIAVITLAVFLTLSYLLPPWQAGSLAAGFGGVLGMLWWRMNRDSSPKLPESESRPARTRGMKPSKAAVVEEQRPEPDRSGRRRLSWTWKGLRYVFWGAATVAVLSLWQPPWFKSLRDELRVGFSGVAIEPNHEGEWQLTPISGKAFSGHKAPVSLLPPSHFKAWDNRLVIVAPAARGSYLKLEGSCLPWREGGPQILSCNGIWARVSRPEPPLTALKTGSRDTGQFSAEFYSGAREAQVSLDLGEGPGKVAGWLKFILAAGKS